MLPLRLPEKSIAICLLQIDLPSGFIYKYHKYMQSAEYSEYFLNKGFSCVSLIGDCDLLFNILRTLQERFIELRH